MNKIQAKHLDRGAYVYIRQSTLHQVRTHTESRRRQYELKDKAEQLGFREVVVIDDDLGISGTGSKERPGFGRLLAAVCAGKVGAVVALEASRLARSNRDWHHLIDLCVLTDALVVDADGVYDPKILSDRLLLGLKGTMSEFELGLLRQRAQEALRQKIRRGEVLTDVPIGYLRTDSNGIEMTPDLQVQEPIRGVFAQFRRLGSVRQVLLWYRQEGMLLCRNRNRSGKRETTWGLPIYNQILKILKNPTYAGAFAYGRTCSKSRVIEGRSRKTYGHAVASDQWQVLLQGHHLGYIGWEEYDANQKRLAANMTKHHCATAGAPRKGSALLAGLLRCARCGRKFHVAYTGAHRRVVRYHCRGAHINHGTAFCDSFGGLRADEAVVRTVLDALGPAGVEASLRVMEKHSADQDRKCKALDLALEKARYEADRARRQYDEVDPANRLVAGELEKRWNDALIAVTEAQARLDEAQQVLKPLTESQLDRLKTLGSDVRLLWSHPATPIELKKRILPAVIREIVVNVDKENDRVEMRIHWSGGAHTMIHVPKNQTGRHRRSLDHDIVELIRELAQVACDGDIAATLNRLGCVTGSGNTWNEGRVRHQRSCHQIPAFVEDAERTWVTLAQAAAELKVSPGVVRKLLEADVLAAKQIVANAPWMIQRADLQRQEVQRYVDEVHRGGPGPRLEAGQTYLL